MVKGNESKCWGEVKQKLKGIKKMLKVKKPDA